MLQAPLRTVTVTIAPLLADIIEQLVQRHVALDIVARFDDCGVLEAKLPGIAPDLVLIGLRSNESDWIGHHVLKLVPMARVIGFSSDARDVYLYELCVDRAALIDVSALRLIEAIRGTAAGKVLYQVPLIRTDVPNCAGRWT